MSVTFANISPLSQAALTTSVSRCANSKDILLEFIAIVIISFVIQHSTFNIKNDLALEPEHIHRLDANLSFRLIRHRQASGIDAMQRVAVVIHVLPIILPGAAEGFSVIVGVDAPILDERQRVLLHHLLEFHLVLIIQWEKAKFQPSTITLSQSPPSKEAFASTARRTVAAVVKRFGLSTTTNVRVPFIYPKFRSLTCSGEKGKAPKSPKTTCDKSPTL